MDRESIIGALIAVLAVIGILLAYSFLGDKKDDDR